MRCQRLAGRLQKARSPRGLTFLTWHSRSIGKAPRCSSTNLNLMAFGSRRTGWLFSRISPFRRGNNPPDCFADPAQILADADLAPKPLFSGQARGPRPRPHPCRDGHSPMGSKSTRRPPDHPQSDVAKARSSVQCAPHPCETHPSCLCPGFISFAAHCAIKGAPPSRDRSSRAPFGQLRDLIRKVRPDCAIDLDTNSYSVPWRLVGETVRSWSLLAA